MFKLEGDIIQTSSVPTFEVGILTWEIQRQVLKAVVDVDGNNFVILMCVSESKM
jgi:hypothetical protein